VRLLAPLARMAASRVGPSLCRVGAPARKAAMILPAQEIRRWCALPAPLIWPFVERSIHNGMTFRLSPAGYDVRIAETVWF